MDQVKKLKHATKRLCAFAALRENSLTTLNLYQQGKMPFVIATRHAAQVAPMEPVFAVLSSGFTGG